MIALATSLGVGLTLPHPTSHWGSGWGHPFTSPSVPTATATASPATPTRSPSSSGLWKPAVNSTWQIVLSNPIDLPITNPTLTPNVDVFDIDLFINDQSTFDTLHKLGKRVICYFSAGSYEPDRPDSAQFQPSDKGNELDGWPGEHWLKLSNPNVRTIMANRIALAATKGCDAVDPDNVDGYSNNNGLGLTPDDSISFIQYLASEAKQHNLSLSLKNAGEIIPSVIDHVHFAVNEQCVQYSECTTWAPFVTASKPVFHIEYPNGDDNSPGKADVATQNQLCSTSGAAAGSELFSTVLKDMSLDGWVQFCNGTTVTTPLASGN